jgi:RNA polymerase-interacting CarD/CdnL/TRCF family regulator
MQQLSTYDVGDWIVHMHYGVGQIKSLEVKCISGEDKKYYRIETEDSTFWMPADQMDSDLLRSVSTAEEIEEAIGLIQEPACEMPANLKTRQSHIKDVQNRNTTRSMALLIRDLRALRKQKVVLNNTESLALRMLTQRFVCEWAIVSGVSSAKAAVELEQLLNAQSQREVDTRYSGIMPADAGRSQ